ncbi:S-adenosyl-L-methionine-dependent methyltransferase [Mycena alexandri]|uniref:rRNA adenine N(6)-methyltransferase n=1 Tax=Mycena alexandri TaxID=1745969 RepID=A0AAD6TG89_9AGAR|nr:S-adenosyl-L-methionine-dependent methyltransferase [Mycena alexandri]
MLRTNWHARRRTVVLWGRLYSTSTLPAALSVDTALPPRSLWRQYFPSVTKTFQHRVSLADANTATMVANAFIPATSRDKTVIEIFPGPGQLTRALLNLPRTRIKKLIVLEHADVFLKYLKPLEAIDDRITVLPLSGEHWGSYLALQDMNILADVPIIPWDQGVHPQLHFVSHMATNVAGEQFCSQLFRNMPDQQWLFKYGRVPMSLLISEYIWKRIRGDDLKLRCKLSMIAAAVSSFDLAVPSSTLQPYASHFHPVPSLAKLAEREQEKQMQTSKPGNPFVAINVTPLEQQWIGPGQLNKWDYCLRHLYVNRAKPIKSALPYLAPGAQMLLKKLADGERQVNPKTPVREMTLQDWSLLVNAFSEWPFAPEDLSITDTIGIEDERHG